MSPLTFKRDGVFGTLNYDYFSLHKWSYRRYTKLIVSNCSQTLLIIYHVLRNDRREGDLG